MKKNRTVFWGFIPLIIIIASTHNGLGQSVQGIWSGTVRMKQVYTGELGHSSLEITTNFTENTGSGTMKYEGELKIGAETKEVKCNGAGNATLYHLDISKDNDTTDIYSYYIHVIGPDFSCSPVEAGINGRDISFGDQVTQQYRNSLSGVQTHTVDNGVGKVITTFSWDLRQNPIDVELIVTPEKYDTWLPEPGINELTVGSVMNISLKLQKRGGGPTTKKAKAFELHFFNTSKEPGITINFPVDPDKDKSMPDLRFLVQPNAEIDTGFQSLKINCPGGCQSAIAKIGSYDGGGWTTLKVEAILKDDDTRIQGRLLVPNGDIDIRIPKREPNSKIAEKWLKENGSPDEMDDDEVSRGNSNDGDGLTAYEEYRGVISEGRFKRLDPKKKEVGICATRTDFALFDEGIKWFKNASDLEPVRFDFDRDEIAGDGKLNVNNKSAHDVDQYAIYIFTGGLGGDGTLGITYGRRLPMIPANITGVIIDWDYIQISYQRKVNNTRPATLKFTLREYLAQTVAHELGHAVNIDHHGGDKKYDPYVVPDLTDMVRIFDRNGNLITRRSYTIENMGAAEGTVESGDMLCMLNYYPYYWWGYTVGADGAHIFNQEPLLPLGRKFCTSKDGTGINATTLYFGKAAKGNCLGQIKLRN